MNPPTVHIIDDDDAVRDSLRLLFRSVDILVTDHDSAQHFLDNYDGRQPGCAVVDIRMPGMSGLQLQQEMKRRDWQLPLIFISGHADVPMAVEAMREGAMGLLQKPFREEELLNQVSDAIAADHQIQENTLAQMEAQQRYNILTHRERETAQRIVAGKANKVIAIDLGISLRTVELHRARVMAKMDVKSVAELVHAMNKVNSAESK